MVDSNITAVANADMSPEEYSSIISQPHRLVNGVPVLLTQDEIDELATEQKVWQAGAAARDLLQQIRDLENTVTPRRLREALAGVQVSIDFIKEVDSQIDALRAQIT